MKSKFWSGKRVKYKLSWRSLFLLTAFWLTLLGIHLAFNLVVKLPQNAQSPPDGILVLGGSISREIYAAKLAKETPNIPILISRGSPDPCIVWVFERAKSPIDNVWLEVCSDSTFTNFMYGLPILENWHVRKVKLITSGTHIRRSKWLAKILLSSHGIWVDMAIAPEKGVPGNSESLLKTGVDLGRGLIWAFLSQMIEPSCNQVYPLGSVDLAAWEKRNFACERQGGFNQ